MIYAYRKEGQNPKLELRIFDRPWGEIEFEVIRNPDPILGNFEQWMDAIFDIVYLGVTFSDFRDWIMYAVPKTPYESKPTLNTGV